MQTEQEVFLFPASFTQEQLWLLDQLDPGDPAYNIGAAIRLRGVLHIGALESSLNELVRRHEVLRTTFQAIEGRVVQLIAPSLELRLPVTHAGPLVDNAAQEISAITDFVGKRFNLERGPLIRATLLRKRADEHLLLFCVHHIVADGWSMAILVREVMEGYRAFSSGARPRLSPVALQYADFAEWQRKSVDSFADELSYWKAKLSGAPILDLPRDYARPAVQRHCGARQCLSLEENLARSVIAFAKRNGVTLFVALLSAFKVLLHRCTASNDILVGTPFAGRDRAEVENLIGCFLNTVIVRTDLGGDPSFDEVLQRVRVVMLDALSHQQIPFDRILRELNPERDGSRTPLFQIFFNMLNHPAIDLKLPGLDVEMIEIPEVWSKFDMTLYVREARQTISFELVYNPDLFSESRMAEMLRQFDFLLSQITRSPHAPISSYSLLTPASRGVLPDPRMPLDASWRGSVPELFRQQVELEPDRLAVVGEHVRWRYKDLDLYSGQLAECLLRHGLEKQEVVAIYAHRSAALITSLMGVLRAGNAFLLLDPSYPGERLAEYVRLAQPKAWIQLEAARSLPRALESLLFEQAWKCRLELPPAHDLRFETLLGSYSPIRPGHSSGPDDLAYLAFTSGSSGRPKGVMGRHGSLTHFHHWMAKTFELTRSDRFSLLSALSHDPLHREVFPPLMLGAAIAIPEEETFARPGGIAEWMRDQAITVSGLTPAMGRLILAGRSNSTPPISSLRRVFFVGDVLTSEDVAGVRRTAPNATVVNLYGSTETQRALAYVIPDQRADSETPYRRPKQVLPLGHGIEDVQLLVINRAQEQAGVGESGEIYFRSPHMAMGYSNEPDLTRERFLTNWFTGAPEDRLYRTGDLGRYLPDGMVEPLGRADQQVKVRGFRIELGEIEAVLLQHPAVKRAAVVVRTDARGEKRIAAYLVPHEDSSWDSIERELTDAIYRKLPHYMMPAAFIRIPALPLNGNGKLDRDALAAPDFEAFAEQRRIEPQTDLEVRLCEILQKALDVPRVGLHDNFFALGGHSLLALRVLAEIQSSLKAKLPFQQIFHSPTVADLAIAVEEAQTRAGEQEAVSHDEIRSAEPPEGPAQISFAQEQLWFLHQLDPASFAYNMCLAVELKGDLNCAALEASLNEVLRRHSVLRSEFVEVAGRSVRRIAPIRDLELPCDDLPGDESIENWLNHHARQCFDLGSSPLLRARLARIAPRCHSLLVVMHHIACDAASMTIFVRELIAAYGCYSRGEQVGLPPLRAKYGDFAAWQRKMSEGTQFDRHLEYWERQLAGMSDRTQSPFGRTHSQAERTLACYSQQLSPDLSGRFSEVMQREQATPFMGFLTAFAVALQAVCGIDEVAIGSPITGRNRTEFLNLIGLFANIHVLRVNLEGDPSFRQLLARVRALVIASQENQDVPFQKVVERLQPTNDAGGMPLFQVSFTYSNEFREMPQVPGLEMKPISGIPRAPMYDIDLNVIEEGAAVRMVWEYDPSVLKHDTVSRLGRSVSNVISAAIESRDLSLGELREMLARSDAAHAAEQERKRSDALREKLSRARERRTLAASEGRV